MSRQQKDIQKKKTYFGMQRSEVAFMAAIGLGLILGSLIKKVRVGIMVGLVIGLIIVFLNNFRAKKQ